jgi:hypothetical protein
MPDPHDGALTPTEAALLEASAHAGHGHTGGHGYASTELVPRISGGSQEHSPDAPNPSEAPAMHAADVLDHELGWHAGAVSEVPGEERQVWPDLSLKELLTLLPLAVLTIYIGVYPQAVLTIVEPALQRVLALVAP